MDYGCGSGILACAALKFGAAAAVGTDVDTLAVEVSGRNAARNGVADRFAAYRCEPRSDDAEPLAAAGLPKGQVDHAFDVTVANILKGPVLDLAERLAGYTKRGTGRVILSGILVTQAPEVVAKYSRWFDDVAVDSEGEWALVTGRRRDTDLAL